MKKFIVLHNLLDIDRYVFPGCNTGIFHRPEEWPKKVKKELSKSEKLVTVAVRFLDCPKNPLYI